MCHVSDIEEMEMRHGNESNVVIALIEKQRIRNESQRRPELKAVVSSVQRDVDEVRSRYTSMHRKMNEIAQYRCLDVDTQEKVADVFEHMVALQYQLSELSRAVQGSASE